MNDDGGTRVANNALAAITLLVAMSDPTEKELMIALIVRMIVPESECPGTEPKPYGSPVRD